MDKIDLLLERLDVSLTAEQYVDDVLSGEQVACKWVRLACERHRRYQERAEELGIYFDEAAAKRVIAFASLLKHSKGKWAGRLIVLEPWQQFIIWMVFGWTRDNHPRWVEEMPDGRIEDSSGTRLFRKAYIEVARKNGKSTLGAILGLYLLLSDGVLGAEVYTVATKKKQAQIVHAEATRMAKSSPHVFKHVTIYRDNIHIKNTASKFEPLGRDSDTEDGLNVSGAICDELHAWKTRHMYDVIDTATGAREKPLLIYITTAGFDKTSVCWEEHEYAEKILEEGIEDDTYFGIIYTLDKGDEEDWDNEKLWLKANPNLGVSKFWFDMRAKAKKAKEMPSALNVFLRKELDVWTQASTRWVPAEHWANCGTAVDALGLRGRSCFGGLDLSSNVDISAWVMVFPPEVEGGLWRIIPRFFIPEDNILERVRRDRVPYDVWVREGFITATPGNVIDYDWIIAQIDEDAQTYDIKEVAFDRWGASRIQTTLMDMGGDDWLVQFGQGFRSMAPAMREMEKLILGELLAHGNNPVLNWMASNLVVRQDASGNMKPDKEKSREKIDGMVALVMAIDRATRHRSGGKSIYEERGLVEV